MDQSTIKRLLGHSLEWYDYALFGYFAVNLGRVFFPWLDSSMQFAAVLALLVAGMAARSAAPQFQHFISSFCPGLRGRFLAFSGMVSALMAFIPPTGGWFPVAMLLILRLLHGLCIGGSGGAEFVHLGKGGDSSQCYSHSAYVLIAALGGKFGGAFLGTLAASAFIGPDVDAFAWRIAFFLALIPAIAAWRFSKAEPPQSPASSPNSARILLLMILLIAPCAASFYILFLFLIGNMVEGLGMLLSPVANINLIGVIVLLGLIPALSRLGDRGLARKIWLGSALVLLVTGPAGFSFLTEGTSPRLALATSFLLLPTLGLVSLTPGLLAQLSEGDEALSGRAYDLAVFLFGGLPLVGFALVMHQPWGHWVPGAFLALTALLAIPVLLTGHKT